MSEPAAAMLDRMAPDRRYDSTELAALAPDLSPDGLRDVMRELWIARAVERAGGTGWRRCVSRAPADTLACAGADDEASLRVGQVKPEDLFDYDGFAGWFK